MTYYAILFGSVILVMSALLPFTVILENWRKNGGYRLHRYLALASLLLGVAGALDYARYGYSLNPEYEVGVQWNGIHSSLLSESTMCWHRECLVLAKKTEVDGEVRPITENPKVRHLKYRIEVEIVDPVLFVRSVGLQPGASCPDGDRPRDCQLRDTVMYEIYEFNNANSKELAKFYNPYDQHQTDELRKLMLGELNDTLIPKGINFRRLVSWSVE